MSFEMPKLPDGWSWRQLEDVCDRISVGHVGETSVFFCDEGGVPLIRSQNVRAGFLDTSDIRYVTEEFHKKSKKSSLRAGDVLIVRVGQNRGDCAVVPEGMGELNCANIVLTSPKGRYSNYLGYYFNTPYGREALLSLSSGSAQLVLNTKAIAKLLVPYPPEDTAVSIGELGRNLDDRIALLRETNATLEAIAQALFKSWFVDFDPVHANAGTQVPSLPTEIQALFPSRLVESPQGLIPEGWKVGTLSDLAEFQNGYAFKSKDWIDSGHPVVKIGDVKPGIIDFTGCSYVASETVSGLDRFRLNRGDLLVGMTGYVGEAGLVPSVETAGYVNQRVGRFSTQNGLHDGGFVYCLVRNPEFKAYAEAQSHGSAQANVSGTALQAYPWVIPSAEILGTFNVNTYPLLESILSNYEKALTLTNLRDALLPRLISGQLRLPEAEAALAEVG